MTEWGSETSALEGRGEPTWVLQLKPTVYCPSDRVADCVTKAPYAPRP